MTALKLHGTSLGRARLLVRGLRDIDLAASLRARRDVR